MDNGKAKKHLSEFFLTKKEDLLDKDGNPKFPWITYEEFKNDYFDREYLDKIESRGEYEANLAFQTMYCTALNRTRLHFEALFPAYNYTNDFNEVLRMQGVEPIRDSHGRPIKK